MINATMNGQPMRRLGAAVGVLLAAGAAALPHAPTPQRRTVTGAAGTKPTLRDLRLRDARHRPRTSSQINPNWFDTMRVTKLPSFEDEFGEDGSTFAGVRQSRLGVRSSTPTALGELKTTFEFELFGTGVDEGQTTFRLRHAYGELGAVRRRPDLEPVHGHRRVPELARVLGTDRAWCSSATSRCAGCRSRATRS